jgi:predicted amidophosphoribosyltransferase
MPYCRDCGIEVGSTTTFCPDCGKELNFGSTEPVEETSQPEEPTVEEETETVEPEPTPEPEVESTPD